MDDKLLFKQESAQPFIPTESNNKTKNVKNDGGGVSLLVVVTACTCLMGSCIPIGYCLGVINTPQEIIRTWMNESVWTRYDTQLSNEQEVTLWSVVVSIFVGGGILGASIGPFIVDLMGRRTYLLLNHLLSLISGMLLVSSQIFNSLELLILGRFISGLFAGVVTWLIPLYLGEVAPSEIRGVMGVVLPLGLNIGVVTSQILGTNVLLGTEEGWPYLLGGFMILGMLAVLMHPFLPESPTYYYLVAQDPKKAHKELQRLRGADSKQAEAERAALEVAASARKKGDDIGRWGVWDVVTSKYYGWPLLTTILLNAGQQFAGINAVFYYSTLIFQTAGLDLQQSQGASIAASAINMVMGIMAIPLVKYCRRRSLLLGSMAGCVISQIILMGSLYMISHIPIASYIAMTSLITFVLAYGFGLGPVPYMLAMELFPDGPRAVGIALGGTTNLMCNLIVGLTFPFIQGVMAEFSFTFFIISSCLLMVYVFKFVPETLGVDSNPPPSDGVSEDGSTDDTIPDRV